MRQTLKINLVCLLSYFLECKADFVSNSGEKFLKSALIFTLEAVNNYIWIRKRVTGLFIR